MDPLNWVMAASIAVWLGLGSYLLFLSLKQNKIERRLNRIERNRHA
ncbi:MAG: CcmD family protein [Desulfovibrionaceae bacterium]|nr:CcmD family protein [Desulfovibrionaceae bacterium]